MRYLEVNVDHNDAVSLIAEKIETKTPFSFTRYGDGEIFVINNVGSPKFKRKVASMYSCPVDEWPEAYRVARDIIIRSLRHTDLVGLLDRNGLIKGHMSVSKANWSIRRGLLGKYDIDVDSLQICDHQIPRGKELGDINQFKKILNGNSLCIISPYEDKLKANGIGKLLEADVSYLKWPMPFDVSKRPELFEELDKISADVIIFGASLFGKDIGVYMKEAHGKVCIDYGATLGGWAGLASRSWFKPGGHQSHCLIQGDDHHGN
jgi:hypothetical protein